MSPQLHPEFGELCISILATAAALAFFLVVVTILRRLGWVGPVEPLGVVERLVGQPWPEPERQSAALSVEYRHSDGLLVELDTSTSGVVMNSRRSSPVTSGEGPTAQVKIFVCTCPGCSRGNRPCGCRQDFHDDRAHNTDVR